MIWFVSIRHYSFASVFRSFGDMELFLEDPGPLVLCEEQRESMVCRVCLPESGGYSGTLLFAFKKMLAFQTSVAPWICNRRRSPSKVYVPWWTPHVECGRWNCAEPTPEDTYHFGSRTSHFVKNSQSIQTKSLLMLRTQHQRGHFRRRPCRYVKRYGGGWDSFAGSLCRP
jgi:hypothetical protein